jgi:hypothetical protein
MAMSVGDQALIVNCVSMVASRARHLAAARYGVWTYGKHSAGMWLGGIANETDHSRFGRAH